MKRVFLYASIGLILLMLFTANSVVAAGWVTTHDTNWTVATIPSNIYGSPDQNVTSLGIRTNYTGAIMAIIGNGFGSGSGYDIIVYGYDVDSTTEQYEVYYGVWSSGYPEYMCAEPIGNANDTDGAVGFEIGDHAETFNMVYLVALSGSGSTWPGPEIDAIYGVH